jgi:hypothetical protein
MSDDYQGSIAQENVSFDTTLLFETVPGDNFYKLMIFVGLDQADASLVTVPVAKAILEVTSSSFATETKGLLKKWLTAYFAGAPSARAYVVTFVDKVLDVWNDDGLEAAMRSYQHLAYWKGMLYYPEVGGVPTLSEQDIVAYTALATLQKATPNLSSPILVNEYDADIMTTPAGTISKELLDDSLDAFSVYHYDALNKAPAYTQLGIALGVINTSGTPVGNSMDYVATQLIDVSGAAGTSLSVTQQNALKALNVGYFKYVGNGTGAVALVGGVSLLGNVVAASWIVQYCDYVNEIRVAELITRMNTYKNRTTYAQILAIMSVTLSAFGDTVGTGRLTLLLITAPTFNKLPAAAGDTIVIPSAWQATYADNVREVRVQGTLTIQG